jgi:hypothetical protein
MSLSQHKFPAQLLDALPHAANSHTDTLGAKLGNFIRDSYPIVSDRYGDLSVFSFQDNACLARS